VLRGRVADGEGRLARVIDVAAEGPPAAAPEAAVPLPEAVQPARVPADNHPGTPAPARAELRALVADDSMMARVFLSRLLAQRGFAVDEVENGLEARAALARTRYDIAFLDAEMPGAGAIEILQDAGATLDGRACVLVKDDDERRWVEALGHVPVLFKPFAEDEVRVAVEALLAGLPRTD
jgi:CheY-like chemotaxis protein